MDKIAY